MKNKIFKHFMKKTVQRFLLSVTAGLIIIGAGGSSVFICHAEAEDYLLEKTEGFVHEGEGYSMTVSWCQNGEDKLFGRLWCPADFDETSEYPAIIYCHGGDAVCDFWEAFYGPELAKKGYVSYAVDCRSAQKASERARGSYSDPTENDEATPETRMSDVSSALDYVESKAFVKQDSIYLFGQSMGGIAVQMVGSKRAEEIAGLIVSAGCIGEDMKDLVPGYEELKNNPYTGEVLFILGKNDEPVTIQRLSENMEWYEECEGLLISDGYHSIGHRYDRAAWVSLEGLLDYLERGQNIEDPITP